MNCKIRVAADTRWPDTTGIGRVQNEMTKRMPEPFEIVALPVSGRIGSIFGPLLLYISLKTHGKNTKLFWNPGFVPPLLGCRKSVVVIHDLTHLRHYTVFHRVYFTVILRRLYRRCAAVICVSDFVKQEFLQWSQMPERKVFVVPNGVDDAFFKVAPAVRVRLGYRYILYPGNARKYKNLERLIEAYSVSRVWEQDIHLVLTTSMTAHFETQIRNAGLTSFVHFLGEYAANDMPELYQGAHMIAYVSLAEGFGLPIIEGMAAGVPVVTSNVTSMPMVAGDAAVLVDPFSVPSIADAIHRVCLDETLRAELIEKGNDQAKKYSWDRSATLLWTIMGEVAASLD
ncbi:glycosyltransferase family 4 protein [Rhizobium sp. GR12]|uniref:glycosyltransferase family 4 protein n=1 Tax=Rhizobium sp. GR12 TaxID=3053925 RepID=UPI002FBEC83A